MNSYWWQSEGAEETLGKKLGSKVPKDLLTWMRQHLQKEAEGARDALPSPQPQSSHRPLWSSQAGYLKAGPSPPLVLLAVSVLQE